MAGPRLRGHGPPWKTAAILRAVAAITALVVGAACAPLPPDSGTGEPSDYSDPRQWPGAGIAPGQTGDPGSRDAMRHTQSEMFELEREAMRSMGELGIRPTAPPARPGAPPSPYYATPRTGEIGAMTGDMFEMQREIAREQQEIMGTFPQLFVPEGGRSLHPYHYHQQLPGR